MTKTLLKLFITSILAFNFSASAEIVLNSAIRNNPPFYVINNSQISGIEYELTKVIFNKAGITVKYDAENPAFWKEILTQIESGEKDFVGGATDTKERENWALFSKTYRLDSESVVTNNSKSNSFTNAAEFIEFIKMNKNLKIGLVDGVVYNSQEINDLIKNPGSTILVIKSSHEQIVELLNNNMVDYIVIDTLLANQELAKIGAKNNNFNVIDINSTMPLHFMFSKKTVNQDIVDKVNIAIDESAKEIKSIMKKHHAY
ncbi:MAG: transporter substrate-binding domain-containing protein [Rickettsiales bacterium]|jgi:polar amino acid transport system substrate-binding protein|nr:transporter substrate-binding domain-containing protein [Rickettsiales bacterium]